MEWFDANEKKPPEDVPVWCLRDSGDMFVGGYCHTGEGWAWTNCYDSWYRSSDKWKAYDFEWDDQYEVTHWAFLPEPPK